MLERANKNTNPLALSVGDYVYMHSEVKGRGAKLKPNFTGPYIVVEQPSAHMVTLKDTQTQKVLKHAIHLDRLKMAYVREPNPQPYFRDSVIAHKSTKNNASTQTTMCSKDTIPLSLVPDHIEQTADPNNSIQPSHHKPVRRSSRQRQCPERFGIPVELSLLIVIR